MSAIEKLFPTSPQERSFQMKARRDAGTAAPNWVPPQLSSAKNAAAVPRGRFGSRASMSAPTAGCIWQSAPIIGSARFWTTELLKS